MLVPKMPLGWQGPDSLSVKTKNDITFNQADLQGLIT